MNQHPTLPDRETLMAFMLEKAYKPLTLNELAAIFRLDKRQRRDLRRLLEEMEAAGEVVLTRTKRYGAPERMNLVVGRLQAHPRGFAFVIPARGSTADVFISAAHMGTAMHDDLVVARLLSKGGTRHRPEGEIIRVLERANPRVVGVLDRTHRYGFVTPADTRLGPDIFIPRDQLHGARTGEVVVVDITRWPEGRRSAEGRITDRLGKPADPGVDMAIIMVKYGLDEDFPAAVKNEVAAMPQTVTQEDRQGREDLRHVFTVTIDGADARDLDDAVSLERLPAGAPKGARWRLGVHIADVSHYVRPGTALDREARRRGTSVYLVDRVVPMLPPELSNGICSLDAQNDRLALSLIMDMDDQAQVVGHRLVPSVIQVDRRLDYDQVQAVLTGGAGDKELDGHLQDMLQAMHRLAQARYRARLDRGSIDFDFPEPKIILDERGKPLDIAVMRRNYATQLIEEFMIAANEIIARRFTAMKIPFLYRIHEPPTVEAVTALRSLLALFNHPWPARDDVVHPRDFQAVLARAAGRPEEYLLQTVTLRTLQRARYSSENLGHFGLASTHYSHFTAPIRRYPDLMVHRIIKLQMAGQLHDEWQDRLRHSLPVVAADSSAAERQAEEAERESVDLKKAQYMEQFIGEEFDGIVSGVTSFGLFVQLPNTVEGLVHVSTMTDDYYLFKESHQLLLGERTGKAFRPGDAVRVKVSGVDLPNRTVDFVLAGDEE